MVELLLILLRNRSGTWANQYLLQERIRILGKRM